MNSRFSDIKKVSRDKIEVRPEIFQGRQKEYASATVDKIVAEGYDTNEEPITVWKNPKDGKYVVISGHSRWEASKQLHKSGKQDLKMMPVREFLGDIDAAKYYAVVESNRSGTQEGLASDISAYNVMKAAGASKEDMLRFFKKESYISRLRDYAFLNERGQFMEALTSEARASFPRIEIKAAWVGQLRREYPSITNAHELEMWNYLYNSKKGGEAAKDVFFNAVIRKVANIGFDPKQPLNLQNQKSESLYKEGKQTQLDEIDEKVTDHVNQIRRLQERIGTMLYRGATSEQTQIKRLKEEAMSRLERVRDLYIKRARVMDTADKADKATVSDLFSGPSKTPGRSMLNPQPNPETTKPGSQEDQRRKKEACKSFGSKLRAKGSTKAERSKAARDLASPKCSANTAAVKTKVLKRASQIHAAKKGGNKSWPRSMQQAWKEHRAKA